MSFKNWSQLNYTKYKEDSLYGRWIIFEQIEPLVTQFKNDAKVQKVGDSENDRPIYSVQLGRGDKKILIWTQMHGNESTGTKALFDLLNVCFKASSEEYIQFILDTCTLLCIPMLNPDGAQQYTRVNAHGVDLNRDAVSRVAIESQILRRVLDDFKPDFCFNLHDQRTIFGVEGTMNPATLSFLAPSVDESRTLTEGRKQTMDVIVAMNDLVQQFIPNHIGRYTDEFYPTATGDNFQKLGYNTVLIESGHYPEDYQREEVRAFTFYALIKGIFHIASNQSFNNYRPYFEIPNNSKQFYDIIHRYTDSDRIAAYQYQEQIVDNQFVLTLKKVEELEDIDRIGHSEIVFETAKS